MIQQSRLQQINRLFIQAIGKIDICFRENLVGLGEFLGDDISETSRIIRAGRRSQLFLRNIAGPAKSGFNDFRAFFRIMRFNVEVQCFIGTLVGYFLFGRRLLCSRITDRHIFINQPGLR